MDWTALLTFAATAGVISAIVNQLLTGGREWLLARSKTKAHAGYHALRLAVLLEAYAYACASFVEENAIAEHRPDEEFPEWKTKLPPLPPYPDDPEGWKSVDLKDAARALNFRNRIDGSQGVISATIEFSTQDLGETLNEHASGRGLEALELARTLRRKHGLGPVELIWDFQDTLARTHAKAVEQQKKNREWHDTIWREATEPETEAPATDAAR